MFRLRGFSKACQRFALLGALLAFGQGAAQAYSLLPEESSIGLDAVGYLHSSDDAPKGFQNTVAPQLLGKWKGVRRGSWIEAGMQGDLLFLFTDATDGSAKPSTYFEMPELFVGTEPELSPVRLRLGRKLVNWSRLDETWELGIWQPRFRWDYFHPEAVGLTGAFLCVEQPWFRVTAFGSPMFVPERGVPIETAEGVFASDSRWFIPPPSMIPIFGRDTPVHYALDMPPMRELLLHPGASLQARVGQESGPWGSIGYAYKPINQLLLASDGRLRLSERNPIYADAHIHPRVAYHHLTTLEGGYDSEPFSAWASLLSERPERDKTSSEWITQEVSPALAVSSTLDFRIAGTPESPTRLQLSYLRQWGGNEGDEGPQAAGGGATSFEARYPYQTALSLGVKSSALARLMASSRVLYDISHEGAVWSTELRYRLHDTWQVGVGADLISSTRSEDADGANLIGRYRANDRVHGGVTYVF